MLQAASEELLAKEHGLGFPPTDKEKEHAFREMSVGLDPEDERAKALTLALVRVSAF
jgi:hypothetical protein